MPASVTVTERVVRCKRRSPRRASNPAYTRVTADGEEPLTPSTPRGRDEFRQSMALARVHQYLSMATPLLWTGQADTIGVLGLAMNACHERNGYVEELDRIKELLSAAQELWRELPEIDEESERVSTRRSVFALVHLADIIAVTPGA